AGRLSPVPGEGFEPPTFGIQKPNRAPVASQQRTYPSQFPGDGPVRSGYDTAEGVPSAGPWPAAALPERDRQLPPSPRIHRCHQPRDRGLNFRRESRKLDRGSLDARAAGGSIADIVTGVDLEPVVRLAVSIPPVQRHVAGVPRGFHVDVAAARAIAIL